MGKMEDEEFEGAGIESMSAKDPNTGERIVVGYSIKVHEKILKEMTLGNKLKVALLVIGGIVVILLGVVVTSGVFGKTLRLIAKC